MPPTHLLYLHGFRSSPLSTKAQRVGRWMAEHQPGLRFWCPQLPPSPRAAIELALAGVATWPTARMAVIGSSLGGYYAAVLAERLGCRAVVLNPSVFPARDLAQRVGPQSTWQSPEDRFDFRPEYIGELEQLEPGPLTRPQRYAAVIAQGDEVLDWREMSARHAGARTLLIEGGDHALSDFDAALAFMLDFLELGPGRVSETIIR